MTAEGTILAVETSCDETSAAVLEGTRRLRSHVIYSQDAHRLYGGVVPEIASRAHLRALDDVVGRALDDAAVTLEDIDVFAATAGPGLIGALLVGLTWTKSAAWARGRPVVGVHHMEGHLFAAELEDPEATPPFVSLLVSGGHTLLVHVEAWGRYRLLGATRDDAAGEAFDKAAKILGLPYPGGPAIEKAARGGDPDRYRLPRPMLGGHNPTSPEYFAFSFSGLKTALRTTVGEMDGGVPDTEVPHLAASFQAAAVEVLAEKTARAARAQACSRVVLGGGVARNELLQREIRRRIEPEGRLFVPSARLATDNAAMIARAARFRVSRDGPSGWELSARSDLPFPGLSS